MRREIIAITAAGSSRGWARRARDGGPDVRRRIRAREGALLQAFDAFKADVRIPWQEMTGNVPKVQHRICVDALKEALTHHQQIQGLLS